MSRRFATEYDKLVCRIDDLRRKDAPSFSSPEHELVDALEACLQGMRAIDAESRKPLAKMSDVSSPSATSCQDTEKERPERASFGSLPTPPSHDEFLARRHAERVLRSSLRHASPEDEGRRQRRIFLTGISWDANLEAVHIIPGRHGSRQPSLPPSSSLDFDFDATAAAFASASRAGVELAMANRSKLQTP
jgi:hypothetical protein